MRVLAGALAAATIAASLVPAQAARREVREGDGFRYYVQEARPDGHVVRRDGTEVFRLRPGDCDWQGRGARSKDCRTGRERVEIRSLDEDRPGQTVCYRMDLRIPSDYNESSPKQTLGQWHDGKKNAVSNRYENGVFEVVVNIRHDLVRRIRIPVRKGSWNRLGYRFEWGSTGSMAIRHQGRIVADLRGIDLLEPRVRSIHLKYGVYRSGLDRRSAPSQSVEFRGVSRRIGRGCSF